MRRSTSRRTARLAFLGFAVALAGPALAGCAAPADESGEIVITCLGCEEDTVDLTVQGQHETAERFNEKYKGQYRIEIIENESAKSDETRVQYYLQLALAGELPDLFVGNPTEISNLREVDALHDFAPLLASDTEWADSFYPEGLEPGTGTDGQQYSIPIQRDTVGIYYNKAIFAEAGVDEFPETWDDVLDACAKIKAIGKACFAMDGEWTTLLVLANLIGTQDGGPEFLASGIRDREYADNAQLIKAVEWERELHQLGYTNSDAFSGEFDTASGPFLNGDAAMIANGPWYVSNIAAEGTPEVQENVDYTYSPGWVSDGRGVVVLAGEGSWLSGTTDERKLEAVDAFVKFTTSRGEAVAITTTSSSFPPVKVDFTPEEEAALSPLPVELYSESQDLPYVYRHVLFASPPNFTAAWRNLWPAYVQGEIDTTEFLTELGEQAAGTGN